MRNGHLRGLMFWTLALAMRAAFAADDPCAGFRWDIGHERALFAAAAETAVAGKDTASAPLLVPDRLYELQLTPQDQVKFAAPPGKKMLADGASAGLARLHLATAGEYRISLDQAFWIDAVADLRLIASSDFQGRPGCQAPHKIVLYPLPGGQDLILQFSGGIGSRLRLTITPASAPAAR
jgi:hypothetical protein